jgi:hypothetical protein
MFDKFKDVRAAAERLEEKDDSADGITPLGDVLEQIATPDYMERSQELDAALMKLSHDDLDELIGIVRFGERANGLGGDPYAQLNSLVEDARMRRDTKEADLGYISGRNIAEQMRNAEQVLTHGFSQPASSDEDE